VALEVQEVQIPAAAEAAVVMQPLGVPVAQE
jgi:hypothetical protein